MSRIVQSAVALSLATTFAHVVMAAQEAFEVASVKVHNPQDGPLFRVRGTSLAARGLTLQQLVERAYPEFNDVGRIVGGPRWMRTARFDINARAASPISALTLPHALQVLLKERFRLNARREQRVVDVLALVVIRSDGRLGPELKPAARECASALRAQSVLPEPCRRFLPPPSSRGYWGGISGFLTMDMFVEQLRAVGKPLFGRPIVDMTGLDGAYDFFLGYGDRKAAAEAVANGISVDSVLQRELPEIVPALREQLGLNLVPRRHAIEVLVIDSVELPSAD